MKPLQNYHKIIVQLMLLFLSIQWVSSEEIIPMDEGWNLISVSQTPQQNSVSTVFSGTNTSPKVWTFLDGQLVLAETVNANEAVWVFSFDGSDLTVE